jgi:hypothetical protein
LMTPLLAVLIARRWFGYARTQPGPPRPRARCSTQSEAVGGERHRAPRCCRLHGSARKLPERSGGALAGNAP